MNKKLLATLLAVVMVLAFGLCACDDAIESTPSTGSESTKAPETTVPEQTSTPAPTTPEPTDPEPTNPDDQNTHQHSYAWSAPVNNVSTYKCSCGDEKGSVRVSVSDRLLIDVEETNLTIDLAQFGTGLTVRSVKLGNVTVDAADLTVSGNNLTVAIAKLLGQAPVHGDSNATIAVAIGDGEATNVTLPVRVAYTISTVEELKALYTVTDKDAYTNPVVGGVIADNVVTPYWYVLTADIDGADFLGNKTEYGNSDESWYTSGQAKQGFIGVFDGQNHTIKNIKILGHGIFGHIGCGTIQNVNFTDIELADGHTCLLGKAVDSTISNVNISNITVGTLDANSGVLFYAQSFSAALSNVNVDLSNVDKAVHVFAKMLDNSEMWEFDNTSFEKVQVTLKSTSGMTLFDDKSMVDNIEGVTVSFVPFTVEKPEANTAEFYYTGSELTYALSESQWYTISGNKQTQVGTHIVTVSLLKNDGIKWADGTTADVTFEFEIREFTTDMVASAAAAFVQKVTDLDTPVYPRDNQKVAAVLADYNALHDLVKDDSTVVAAKATLDGYKAEAEKWADLGDQFAPSITLKALSGYDQYYLVMYNPTDAGAAFYHAGAGGDWSGKGQTTLTAKAWTQVEFDLASATAGGAYCYVDGDHTKFTTEGSGWVLKIYGKNNDGSEPQKIHSFGSNYRDEVHGDLWQGQGELGDSNKWYGLWCGVLTQENLTAFAEYTNLYVYVYNPNEYDVVFGFQNSSTGEKYDFTTLKAGQWTKCTISELIAANPAQAGLGIKTTDDEAFDTENFATNGYRVSSVYGIAAE